jgi:Fur family transcriptional regulator, stress-responsive regulator
MAALAALLAAIAGSRVTQLRSDRRAASALVQAAPAGSPARYETRVGDNHHHLVCRTCGTVEDVECVVGSAPCLRAAADAAFPSSRKPRSPSGANASAAAPPNTTPRGGSRADKAAPRYREWRAPDLAPAPSNLAALALGRPSAATCPLERRRPAPVRTRTPDGATFRPAMADQLSTGLDVHGDERDQRDAIGS